jgi:hypothetical protein
MDPFLKIEFFDFLKIQLAIAIGPIAEYIIKDALQKFGSDFTRFPRDRVAELVGLLSRQIRRPEKKLAFEREMVKKIQEAAIG